MTDIFLSYSSADRAAANAVQAALTARGYDVFWDQEVPAGQDWDDWIRGKLMAARLCIVLWSKTSIASPNVRHEAMIARDGKRLVPAMIETLKPADFPMGLYLVQSVQLNDWRDAGGPGMTRLMAEVAARLGGSGAQPPMAVKPARGRSSNVTGALIAVAVVAALAGGGWYFTGRGGHATTGAATTVAPEVVATLSQRITGHWRWNSTMACAAGTLIATEGDNLVFTSPDSRYVHAIESDTSEEVRTRVTAPEFALGEEYVFTESAVGAVPDGYVGALDIENKTAGTRDIWERCEVTP